LDRVQDYEILIDDDKERALQIIKHVLGAELSDDEELDLSVTSYDLKLVRGLRPVSQDQVWQMITLLLSEAFVRDSVFAAEVFRRLGFEDGEELFETLVRSLWSPLHLWRLELTHWICLAMTKPKPTDFLLTWTF